MIKDDTYYRARLVTSQIPAHMHDAMLRYLLHGLPPGSFLRAVLENDLTEACKRADTDNRYALCRYVDFLYSHAPMAAWGSPDHVTTWMAARRAEAVQSHDGS